MYEVVAVSSVVLSIAFLVSTIIGFIELPDDNTIFKSKLYILFVAVYFFLIASLLEMEIYSPRRVKETVFMPIQEVVRMDKKIQYYVEWDAEELNTEDFEEIEEPVDIDKHHVKAERAFYPSVNWLGEYQDWEHEVVKK